MIKVVEVSIEKLVPYKMNPGFNDDAVDQVAASIREFGFKVPIVADKDGVIVAGHTRLKAAAHRWLLSERESHHKEAEQVRGACEW